MIYVMWCKKLMQASKERSQTILEIQNIINHNKTLFVNYIITYSVGNHDAKKGKSSFICEFCMALKKCLNVKKYNYTNICTNILLVINFRI